MKFISTNAKFMSRSYLGKSAVGYEIVARFLRMKSSGILLENDTDLCIEGYPRCANTFAVLAFQSVQPKDYRIAHHAHLAGHVIQSIKQEIPAIVLIRDPLDAACSLHLREPALSPANCLKLYVDFYEPLRDYRDRFVVAPFEQITSDYARIIRAVNVKFSTEYVPYENSPERDEQVMDQMRSSRRMNESNMRVSVPTKERSNRKDEVLLLLKDSRHDKLLAQANLIFRDFMTFSNLAAVPAH